MVPERRKGAETQRGVSHECREALWHWVATTQERAIRALNLMEAALREPHSGIGKPEHLKHLGGDVWSRRINEADRLVCEVFADRVEFLQARYHYG